MEIEYKEGDAFKRLPGFNTGETSGGGGYEAGRVFNIESGSMNHILWPSGGGSGIYGRACEPILAIKPLYKIY